MSSIAIASKARFYKASHQLVDYGQKKNLKSAFDELSDRQKEILYLKYYSEMDYEEITQIMDMNYQSARNLVSRAIQKLAKHMLMLVFFLLGKKMGIPQWVAVS